jgi:hypothetical protein
VRTGSHRLEVGRRANKGTQYLINLTITLFFKDMNSFNYFRTLIFGREKFHCMVDVIILCLADVN